jgi:uncharacterized membrane protein
MKDLILKVIGYVPRFITDFGGLLVAPKRFLRPRNSKPLEALPDALVFLAICLSLGLVLQLQLLPKGEDLWASLARSAITTLLALALMTGALWLAWRLVGGRASASSYFVTQAYVGGAASFLILIPLLISEGVFKVFDPALYVQVQAARLGRGPLPDLTQSVAPLAYLIAVAVAFVLTASWGFATWGAYRELNQVGRFRSAVALGVAGILGWFIVGAVLFLAQAIMPGAV